MNKTGEDIAAITAMPGRRSGRRWYRVALAAVAMALPLTGVAMPAGAAAATTAGVRQVARAPGASSQLLAAQRSPRSSSAQFPGPPGGWRPPGPRPPICWWRPQFCWFPPQPVGPPPVWGPPEGPPMR